MSSTPIVDVNAPRREPLRVELTPQAGLEQLALAMALNIARMDARLSLRKLGAKFVVESPALTTAEETELLERIRGAFVSNLVERSAPPSPTGDSSFATQIGDRK